MSDSITIDISWPTDLPLPFLDFNGAPRNTTLVSGLSAGRITRRSRYQTSYNGLAVTWVLDETQYAAFRGFFDDSLGNGAAQFSIELRFPLKSELTEWAVRFVDGFEAQHEDGNWIVTSQLDLVNRMLINDAAPRVGYARFYVDVTGPGEADDIPFETSESFPFYVSPT